MCQALMCGFDHAAGRYGDARIGSRTKWSSSKLFARPWLAGGSGQPVDICDRDRLGFMSIPSQGGGHYPFLEEIPGLYYNTSLRKM
jgi:hypothetical protein